MEEQLIISKSQLHHVSYIWETLARQNKLSNKLSNKDPKCLSVDEIARGIADFLWDELKKLEVAEA